MDYRDKLRLWEVTIFCVRAATPHLYLNNRISLPNQGHSLKLHVLTMHDWADAALHSSGH